MARVLIIDDDNALCDAACRCIERMGHIAKHALSLKEGSSKLKGEGADVLFLDVRLPDGNGLAALPAIRKNNPDMEVIIITGEADVNDAELAIKSGAWDYIKKPLTMSEIELQLTRALQYRQEKATRRTAILLKRGRLAGESAGMKACLGLLAQAASGDANVLVVGETGTGKELFCRAIHENSPRAGKPFVVVDCAALPETLVESVLFGHVKGAFTGADGSQAGLIKQADGGTLFLDEIGELPFSMQKAFLRVLQERRFRPVGSNREESSDFRLVAATNRDLNQMVDSGEFRKDLLFRVQSLRIELPPLRERQDDIRPITEKHMERYCKSQGIPVKQCSSDFLNALESHNWPGNVRELVGVIEAAVAATSGEHTLFATHLPMELRVAMTRKTIETSATPKEALKTEAVAGAGIGSFREFRSTAIDRAERQYLENLVSVAGKNVKEACRISGLSKSRLYQLLQKYDLSLFE